jgi:tRNA G10  N-methylase Trm11
MRGVLATVSGVVLDPFAGVGGIHTLAHSGLTTVGVELEPEWATAHPRTLRGDSRSLPFPDGAFDAIATSPAYGNRMADHHEAQERCRPCEGTGAVGGEGCSACGGEGRREYRRITYRHTLGRALTDGNSGAMQWGEAYRTLHREVWQESVRVLKPGGLFVFNISDHVRGGKVMPVTAWHTSALADLGVIWKYRLPVETPRMRYGQNSALRVSHEDVYVGVL